MNISPVKYPARSILVIRMSGIGDMVWSTPLLANLRHHYPDAHIGYVARPWCAPVFENNPAVDELILFEDDRLWEQAKFLRRLRRKRFELSIDIVCTPATAIQSFVSGAKVRVGYDFRIRRHWYTHVLSREEANHGHEAEFDLFALRALDLPVVHRALVWNVSRAEEEDAARVWDELGLARDGVVIGMVPTGGYTQKKWPAEYYAELAKASARLGNAQFLMVWGNEIERRDGETVRRIAGPHVKVAPPSSLRRTAALLRMCTIVTGNDTGPLHIATALNPRVLGLYGPAETRAQGPYGPLPRTIRSEVCSMGVRNCGRCTNPTCMTELKPEMVIRKLEEMLPRS